MKIEIDTETASFNDLVAAWKMLESVMEKRNDYGYWSMVRESFIRLKRKGE